MEHSHITALKKAIKMHQMHIDRPTTATTASQRALMRLLKAALPKMSGYSKMM